MVPAHRWAGVTAQPELFAGLSRVTGEMFQVCLGKQQLCPGEGEASDCKNKQAVLGEGSGVESRWKLALE